MYSQLKQELKGLVEGERNFIANAANFSSLIFNSLKEINWVGFYFRDKDELILGPFHGKVSCLRLPWGKGVCWTAAKNRQSIVVNDVSLFPGHIACDENSKSEMVIPIIYNNLLYGVLDIDAPILSRFDKNDEIAFTEMLEILTNASDVEALGKYYGIL